MRRKRRSDSTLISSPTITRGLLIWRWSVGVKRRRLSNPPSRIATEIPGRRHIRLLTTTWRFQRPNSERPGRRLKLNEELKRDPKLTNKRLELGSLYLWVGEREAARAQYEMLTQSAPALADDLMNLMKKHKGPGVKLVAADLKSA